jgi:hypothetical protein
MQLCKSLLKSDDLEDTSVAVLIRKWRLDDKRYLYVHTHMYILRIRVCTNMYRLPSLTKRLSPNESVLNSVDGEPPQGNSMSISNNLGNW